MSTDIQQAIDEFFAADYNPTTLFTKKQFIEFCVGRKILDYNDKRDHGKKMKLIFADFLPFHDVSYFFCPADGKIYEDRFYIGD